MEPVVGVDVAKGSSVVQAFLKRNEPRGKMETISNEEGGFKRLGEILAELQAETMMNPIVVLEATGHYHRSLVAYLERSGWTYFIVNPLQSKQAKGTQLRKVKTDTADVWHLADMYYRGDVTRHRTWGESFTELQHVTRQHEFVTGMFKQPRSSAQSVALRGMVSLLLAFSEQLSKLEKQLDECASDPEVGLVKSIPGNRG